MFAFLQMIFMWKLPLFQTVLAVLASVALYSLFNLWLGYEELSGYLLSAIIPAIVAYPMTFTLYRYQEKIKNNASLIFQQKKELEALNQLKNKLFSIVAHDTKGPLGSLQSMLDLLQNGDISQEEFEQHVKNLSVQTNTVLNLFTNLLHWVKSQMEGFVPHNEDINAKELLIGIWSELHSLTLAKNQELTIEVEDGIALFCDKEMIKVILRNLLHNAIKYSKNGGSIKVKIWQDEEFKGIEVIDHGTGMSKSDLDNIFNLHYQQSKDGTNKEKGTGLGLALIKNLCQIIGCEISAESELGVGTTVTLKMKIR